MISFSVKPRHLPNWVVAYHEEVSVVSYSSRSHPSTNELTANLMFFCSPCHIQRLQIPRLHGLIMIQAAMDLQLPTSVTATLLKSLRDSTATRR